MHVKHLVVRLYKLDNANCCFARNPIYHVKAQNCSIGYRMRLIMNNNKNRTHSIADVKCTELSFSVIII